MEGDEKRHVPIVSRRNLSNGLALSLPKAVAKPGLCAAVSGLALSVIASRCHLPQSGRPWQSTKFPGLYFTPCCRKKSRQALRGGFTPLPKAPTLGELDAVRRPERARMLTARLHPGLDDAYDGADFRKARSKLTRCVLVSGLALSVIASRCHLPQSGRPWQSTKFPGLYFTPCCRKKSRQALRSGFTPLPERASSAAARLCVGLDWVCDRPRASPLAGTQCVGSVQANTKRYQTPVKSKLGVYSSLALLFCCI